MTLAEGMKRNLRKAFHRCAFAGPLTPLYERFHSDRSLGARGERQAERFLLKQGYVIVARRYTDKAGEIDLIAVDDRTVVFVEVKTRRSDFLDAVEAVDKTKQQRLTKTATRFLKLHRLVDCPSRFDVIAVTWPDDRKPPEIRHYENAFEAAGEFQLF